MLRFISKVTSVLRGAIDLKADFHLLHCIHQRKGPLDLKNVHFCGSKSQNQEYKAVNSSFL